jgi:hypothetical protein
MSSSDSTSTSTSTSTNSQIYNLSSSIDTSFFFHKKNTHPSKETINVETDLSKHSTRSPKSGLYIVTCKTLDKHYIGCSNHVTRLINAHKSKLRRKCHDNSFLQNDFNLYGETDFIFQKLEIGVGLDKKSLEGLETQLLVTYPKERLYNVYTNWRVRGSETNPFFGKEHTKEARLAQSLQNKGQTSHFLGKTQSAAVKQQISEMNRGMTSTDRRKPLYIKDVFYESVSDAETRFGLSRRLIRQRCNSTEERFKDYRWAPKNEE